MSVFTTIRARLASMLSPVGAWFPAVREPYTGAWQLNQTVTVEDALANPTYFGCVSRICQDIAKIAPPVLVEESSPGIWTPTTNSAYSPVLDRPNGYQTWQQFAEQWVSSKLLTGNTYVLLERDVRSVVNALHVLDAAKVKPLQGPDGSLYYELQSNPLAGLPEDGEPTVIAARDIAHDRYNTFYHPLVGIPPFHAIAGVLAQAKSILDAGTHFFAKGGRPGGVLIAPTKIDDLSKQRMKAEIEKLKAGDVLLGELGMKWEPSATSPIDAQVVEQLAWCEETICSVFGMPISILNSRKQPPYANAEASQLQYKSACLEPLLVGMENILRQALSLPSYLRVEFDIDLLIWMDTATRTAAARDGIGCGAMAPNEARERYFGLPPVAGGEYPVLQQQNWPLPTLARREAPMGSPAPATPVGALAEAVP